MVDLSLTFSTCPTASGRAALGMVSVSIGGRLAVSNVWGSGLCKAQAKRKTTWNAGHWSGTRLSERPDSHCGHKNTHKRICWVFFLGCAELELRFEERLGRLKKYTIEKYTVTNGFKMLKKNSHLMHICSQKKTGPGSNFCLGGNTKS